MLEILWKKKTIESVCFVRHVHVTSTPQIAFSLLGVLFVVICQIKLDVLSWPPHIQSCTSFLLVNRSTSCQHWSFCCSNGDMNKCPSLLIRAEPDQCWLCFKTPCLIYVRRTQERARVADREQGPPFLRMNEWTNKWTNDRSPVETLSLPADQSAFTASLPPASSKVRPLRNQRPLADRYSGAVHAPSPPV